MGIYLNFYPEKVYCEIEFFSRLSKELIRNEIDHSLIDLTHTDSRGLITFQVTSDYYFTQASSCNMVLSVQKGSEVTCLHYKIIFISCGAQIYR